jgi:hypothetical protein
MFSCRVLPRGPEDWNVLGVARVGVRAYRLAWTLP